MSTQISAAPGEDPLSLTEAKDHLRVTSTAEDTYITSLITAATKHCEQYTNRKFITQTWDYFADNWPDCEYVELPFAKVQSVTTVKYKDSAGALTTMSASDYVVDGKREPGIVRMGPSVSVWPTLQGNAIDRVEIRFVCGYGAADSVPKDIKQALLLFIAEMYENREEEVTGTIVSKLSKTSDYLLFPHRVWFFP